MTNYTDVATVKARLLNSNLGVSTGIVCTDTEIAELLTEADEAINFELGPIASNTTNTLYTPILKRIATNLVSMAILRGRHYKETTTEVNVERYYTITPDFTYADLRRLRIIRQRLRGNTVSKNYNTQTGLEVDSSNSYYYGS